MKLLNKLLNMKSSPRLRPTRGRNSRMGANFDRRNSGAGPSKTETPKTETPPRTRQALKSWEGGAGAGEGLVTQVKDKSGKSQDLMTAIMAGKTKDDRKRQRSGDDPAVAAGQPAKKQAEEEQHPNPLAIPYRVKQEPQYAAGEEPGEIPEVTLDDSDEVIMTVGEEDIVKDEEDDSVGAAGSMTKQPATKK